MTQRARTAKIAPPQVSDIFAGRVREARNARGWTQQDLANEMGKLGAPMDRTTIAKLEKRQREARINEAVAIAAALDVALTCLLFPIEGDSVYRPPLDKEGRPMYHARGAPDAAAQARVRGRRDGPLVCLAPALRVNQVKARRWARGELPLDPANFRTYAEQTAGDHPVSSEELSRAERQILQEENEQRARKLGIVVHAPGEQPPPATPTKRGRGSAGKDD